jgi:hypothetical protein
MAWYQVWQANAVYSTFGAARLIPAAMAECAYSDGKDAKRRRVNVTQPSAEISFSSP